MPGGCRRACAATAGSATASYLSQEPDWRPPLPAAGPAFGLADLLTLDRHDR
jgi:hypothetical protein